MHSDLAGFGEEAVVGVLQTMSHHRDVGMRRTETD